MHNRRLVTPRVVGMAMLLMSLSAWGILANDGGTSTGTTTTPSTESAAKPSASAEQQINALKQQMALQQQQIEQMQKALQQQKQLLEQLTKPAPATEQATQPATPAKPATGTGASPATQSAKLSTGVGTGTGTEQASQPHPASLGEVATTSPMIPQAPKQNENAIAPVGASPTIRMGATPGGGEDTSPLQIHIGNATITPVGFMDFTSVFRTKVTNGSIGTNFGSVPYDATGSYAPNLSEFRLSTENSRIGFRADADVLGAHVMGYMEADFHGNNATSVAEVSNSNTLRERLYWVDINTGHFEVMAGQSWSLITPGRSGISPLPADVFYTQDMDLNYQLGLFWGRTPELRFVFHPNKQVALAFALDSPDQYAGGNGGSGTITLPALLNTTATYQGELDYGSGNTLSTPNLAPDMIVKLAVDPSKRFHFEVGGITRTFKVYDPLNFTNNDAQGGGGFLNMAVEPVKGLRFLTNNFFSDGGGRWIFGMAPDLIAHADGTISLIHADSTVTGLEFTKKKTIIFAYYGGVYIARNTAYDANGTTLIGYGYHGSPTSQNRELQEGTVGFNQTFWKNPKYGATSFIGQASWLSRAPWYAAPGAPANASLEMIFFDLRYTLPGSAPTMGK